jgi:hypothetical protein
MGEEHRHFTRLGVRVLTFYKIIKTGKVQRALTKDLSGGGLCFTTETVLEPGTQLEIEVRLPDRDTPIVFGANVVWSCPVEGSGKTPSASSAETGVQITAIGPKDQALLLQYAKLNAPSCS